MIKIDKEKKVEVFVEGFVTAVENWRKKQHKKTVEKILIEDLNMDLNEEQLKKMLDECICNWRKKHPRK